MTQLSPAAQKIIDAFDDPYYPDPLFRSFAIAAALRVLADNVVPEDYASYTGHVEYDQGLETRNDTIRESILNIVTELKNINNDSDWSIQL